MHEDERRALRCESLRSIVPRAHDELQGLRFQVLYLVVFALMRELKRCKHSVENTKKTPT